MKHLFFIITLICAIIFPFTFEYAFGNFVQQTTLGVLLIYLVFEFALDIFSNGSIKEENLYTEISTMIYNYLIVVVSLIDIIYLSFIFSFGNIGIMPSNFITYSFIALNLSLLITISNRFIITFKKGYGIDNKYGIQFNIVKPIDVDSEYYHGYRRLFYKIKLNQYILIFGILATFNFIYSVINTQIDLLNLVLNTVLIVLVMFVALIFSAIGLLTKEKEKNFSILYSLSTFLVCAVQGLMSLMVLNTITYPSTNIIFLGFTTIALFSIFKFYYSISRVDETSYLKTISLITIDTIILFTIILQK